MDNNKPTWLFRARKAWQSKRELGPSPAVHHTTKKLPATSQWAQTNRSGRGCQTFHFFMCDPNVSSGLIMWHPQNHPWACKKGRVRIERKESRKVCPLLLVKRHSSDSANKCKLNMSASKGKLKGTLRDRCHKLSIFTYRMINQGDILCNACVSKQNQPF